MRATIIGLLAAGALLSAVSATGAARAAPHPTVIVPTVGSDYSRAYDRLHAAGLRVTLPAGLSFGAVDAPVVGRTSPPPGRRVGRGSAVTLVRSRCCVGVGSPAVPTGPLPSAVVPSFLGQSASVAAAWVTRHRLSLAAHLGPLIAGGAAQLLANYRITRQRPAPGTTLSLGIAGSGSFQPTPLTIWAAQRAG